MPKEKCLVKKYRFSQEELKVMPKGKGLDKIYRFNQEKLKVVPKRKGLTKKKRQKLCQKAKVQPRERFSHEKIEGRQVRD